MLYYVTKKKCNKRGYNTNEIQRSNNCCFNYAYFAMAMLMYIVINDSIKASSVPIISNNIENITCGNKNNDGDNANNKVNKIENLLINKEDSNSAEKNQKENIEMQNKETANEEKINEEQSNNNQTTNEEKIQNSKRQNLIIM